MYVNGFLQVRYIANHSAGFVGNIRRVKFASQNYTYDGRQTWNEATRSYWTDPSMYAYLEFTFVNKNGFKLVVVAETRKSENGTLKGEPVDNIRLMSFQTV